MTPTQNSDADFSIEEQPTETYKINSNNKRISGRIKGLSAVEQAIYKILGTERYQHLIYSWNYGVELKDYIGQPIEYAYPEIKRQITEALLQDERIETVDNFSYTKSKGKLSIAFTVTSSEGDIDIETEVDI